jgi:hypothetical protein
MPKQNTFYLFNGLTDDHLFQIYHYSKTEQRDFQIFNAINKDYMTAISFKGKFLDRLISFFRCCLPSDQRHTSFLDINGRVDCLGFASYLYYGVIEAQIMVRRKHVRMGQFFKCHLNYDWEETTCGEVILMRDEKGEMVHCAISLGIVDPYTHNQLYISKYGCDGGIFVKTISQMKKFYNRTSFISVYTSFDDKFKIDSCLNKNEISICVYNLPSKEFKGSQDFIDRFGEPYNAVLARLEKQL